MIIDRREIDVLGEESVLSSSLLSLSTLQVRRK